MGLINLRHSDHRQHRQRFVRPLLELLEDRLQPGSLLLGPQWSWFGSGFLEPDAALSAKSGNEDIAVTPAERSEPSRDLPVAIVATTEATDSQEARTERPPPANSVARAPRPLTTDLLGLS